MSAFVHSSVERRIASRKAHLKAGTGWQELPLAESCGKQASCKLSVWTTFASPVVMMNAFVKSCSKEDGRDSGRHSLP